MTRLDESAKQGEMGGPVTKRPWSRGRWWIVGAVVIALAVGGVVGGLVATSETKTPGTTPANTAVPSASVSSSLATAYNAEQQAKATYDNVIGRLGDVRPFATVSDAEATHIGTVQDLAQSYSVTLSTGPFTGQPSPATLTEACRLGVGTEQNIVSMYSQLLTEVSGYPDLTQAFSNLQAAARDNHLPAFESCLNSTPAASSVPGSSSSVPQVSPTAPGTPGTTPANTAVPSASVSSSLATAYNAEQQAKATYDNVIGRLGDVRPFATVSDAEATHIGTVQDLAQRYSVTLSTGPFTGQPSPATLTEACRLGVGTEQNIVSMYSQLLTEVSGYPDLTQAFSNLQAAARDNHLPAFERCA